MSQVNTELGNPTSTNISLNQASVRALASIPSGQISMSDLHGKSSYPTFGYFALGYSPSLGNMTKVQRIEFSSETGSSPNTTFPYAGDAGTGLEDGSGGYGYVAQGYIPSGYSNRLQRIDFSNDSTSSPGTMTYNRYGAGGTSTPTYGYLIGGSQNYYKTDRIEFSNNTVSPRPNYPGGGIGQMPGTIGFDNPTHGYYSGNGKNIKYTFSTETYSLLPGSNDLPSSVYFMSTVQTSSYGYYGYGTSSNDQLKKFDFSNDTRGDQFGSMPMYRPQAAGAYNDSYGYFAGGSTPNAPDGPRSVLIDRFDFSAGTQSQRPSSYTLPTGSSGLSAMLA